MRKMKRPVGAVVGIAMAYGLCASSSLAADLAAPAASAPQAASAPSTATQDASCHETANFVPPRVTWMGKFVYQLKLTVKGGKLDDVDVSPYRGADDATNEVIDSSLKQHLLQHYVCGGADRVETKYMILNLKHDVPELSRQMAADLAEREANSVATASVAAGAASDVPSAYLVPHRPEPSGMVCTRMGKPERPSFFQEAGQVELHVFAQVTAGKIGIVDVRLKRGSAYAKLNQQYIDSVTEAIRKTYQCGGDHVFEQTFVFGNP